MRERHTFVVPAFGDSPYLAECLRSLAAQSVTSRILVTTSTPSPFLEDCCARHGVELRVRSGSPTIAGDWNFALEQVDEGPFTIAHQDDLYDPRYTQSCLAMAERRASFSMIFTDYREIEGERPRRRNLLLSVKRALIEWAFFPGLSSIGSRFRKRLLLRFGNPVICPSVLLRREHPAGFRFRSGLSINLDWEAWLTLAEEPGEFCFLRSPLVVRRIHAGSETTAGLRERRRQDEDREMFERLWPKWVARCLLWLYRASYTSNG